MPRFQPARAIPTSMESHVSSSPGIRFLHRYAALPFLLLALTVGSVAHAQPSPALDRFSLLLGTYYADSSTLLHAQTTDGSLGGTLDLEKDLGLRPREWSPRGQMDVLIGDSHGLSFDYYRYDRQHGAALQNNFTYEGNTYHATTDVFGSLRFDFGSAAYRWWLGHGSDVVGIGLGAGYYKIDAALSGRATVAGMQGYAKTATTADAWAPLLELGWRHAFNSHWRMYADASGVKKNGGPLYGHIYNASLGMQWFPTHRLGLSLAYGINRIRLIQRRNGYSNRLDLKLKGPSLFATFRL